MRIFLDIILNKNVEIQESDTLQISYEPDNSYIITLGHKDTTYKTLQEWLKNVFYSSYIYSSKDIINNISSSILRVWIDSYNEFDIFDLTLTGQDIKNFEIFSIIIDIDYQNIIKPN